MSNKVRLHSPDGPDDGGSPWLQKLPKKRRSLPCSSSSTRLRDGPRTAEEAFKFAKTFTEDLKLADGASHLLPNLIENFNRQMIGCTSFSGGCLYENCLYAIQKHTKEEFATDGLIKLAFSCDTDRSCQKIAMSFPNDDAGPSHVGCNLRERVQLHVLAGVMEIWKKS